MKMRLLVARSDSGHRLMLLQLLDAAVPLVPFDVEVAWATSRDSLLARVSADADDVVLLDWSLAGPETPDLIREARRLNPGLRTVVLLPLNFPEYRAAIWEAGGCTSIPREHLNEEWLSSALCLMCRAVEREARLISDRPPSETSAGAEVRT